MIRSIRYSIARAAIPKEDRRELSDLLAERIISNAKDAKGLTLSQGAERRKEDSVYYHELMRRIR